MARVLEACFSPDGELSLRGVNRPCIVAGQMLLPAEPEAPIRLPGDLYLWPTTRSYTRQPAAEFHTLGSPPLLAAALRAVCAAGARLAQPGEFTLRAFLAGRLDLTQAEAVLGLIDARGPEEFDAALTQLAGGIGRPLHALRDSLLDLVAHLEAGLDFVEEDIQFIAAEDLRNQLQSALWQIESLVAQMSTRTETADGPRIVLVGSPNVGKSSLFNSLVGAGSVALVSTQPGTTRDYLTAWIDLDGIRCQLIDTAGVEVVTSADPRGAAQAAASRQQRQADIRVLCLDSSRSLDPWEQTELARAHANQNVVVVTKCDQPAMLDLPAEAVSTSALGGIGFDRLRERLRHSVCALKTPASTSQLATATRCLDSLRLARESLARAVRIRSSRGGEELIAAEVRVALDALGLVVGAIYADDILDRIFSRFCIGK